MHIIYTNAECNKKYNEIEKSDKKLNSVHAMKQGERRQQISPPQNVVENTVVCDIFRA